MNEWMMKESKLTQDTATEAKEKKTLFNRLQPTNQPTTDFYLNNIGCFLKKNTVVQCVWEKKSKYCSQKKKEKETRKRKIFCWTHFHWTKRQPK